MNISQFKYDLISTELQFSTAVRFSQTVIVQVGQLELTRLAIKVRPEAEVKICLKKENNLVPSASAIQ